MVLQQLAGATASRQRKEYASESRALHVREPSSQIHSKQVPNKTEMHVFVRNHARYTGKERTQTLQPKVPQQIISRSEMHTLFFSVCDIINCFYKIEK